MPDNELVAIARRLADDVLFPSAIATDTGSGLPVGSLDALAAAGLYGLFGPQRFGGLDADADTGGLVIEALAGGCLTSTFIWMQHHASIRTLLAAPEPLASLWVPRLCSGDLRAGVAFAHLRREGRPAVSAGPVGDGRWMVNGTAPWMTGWGGVDVVNVAAVHDDRIVWFLADAKACSSVAVRPLALAAVNASGTVEMSFADHVVAPGRVLMTEDLAQWLRRDRLLIRQSGSLSLGLVLRCADLLGRRGDALVAATRKVRTDLDRHAGSGDLDALSQARAEASWLAVRAASALIAATAGRSMVTTSHAQRLGREAQFLLVQGQTASIREAQLRMVL